METFTMKDLAEIKYFLGNETARSNNGPILSKRKFALEMICELGLSSCKPVKTSFKLNVKLTIKSYDKHVRNRLV